MTSLETIEQVTEENLRLADELMLIKERLKILTEFKITFDLYSNKIKQSLESNEWQKFEILLTRINEFCGHKSFVER